VSRRSESEHASQAAQPHSLRDRIRETTIQEILTAAEEVFATSGLHAARMDDIAARAGVSVGTLYNHFADRDALLAGLQEARRTEMLGALDAVLARSPKPPFRERLRATLVVLLEHCERHRRFASIVLQREVGRYEEKFPLAGGKSADTMREIHGRLDKLMKQGLREKALRPETADLAALFLLGMIRALIIRDAVLAPGAGIVDESDRLLGAFLGGVGEAEAA
jgi:AcrR family transcriptional regulator